MEIYIYHCLYFETNINWVIIKKGTNYISKQEFSYENSDLSHVKNYVLEQCKEPANIHIDLRINTYLVSELIKDAILKLWPIITINGFIHQVDIIYEYNKQQRYKKNVLLLFSLNKLPEVLIKEIKDFIY